MAPSRLFILTSSQNALRSSGLRLRATTITFSPWLAMPRTERFQASTLRIEAHRRHPQAMTRLSNTCPECSAPAKVAEVRKLPHRGICRRWFQCKGCGYRWSHNEIIGLPQPRIKTEITDEILREILTGTASPQELTEKYGIHRTTTSSIRLGKIHANRVPDVPRWTRHRTCHNCQHWKHATDDVPGRCWFDFPDPIEDGMHAARWCNTYLQSNDRR
jgi:hypothetical protein